jgi:thiamine biosynthesis protein ThiS
VGSDPHTMVITLNGERYQLDEPISVASLLARLEIDPRRVAIEHNLEIIKRHTFTDVVIGEGDTLEIVNFVGGG